MALKKVKEYALPFYQHATNELRCHQIDNQFDKGILKLKPPKVGMLVKLLSWKSPKVWLLASKNPLEYKLN